jgi:hypothetical protein
MGKTKLSLFGIGSALGIVPVLFIMGVFLKYTKLSIFWGELAIGFAIFIGICYAVLGVFGIMKRLGFKLN